MAAVAQPLMYGEYVLFRGTSRYSLNQGEVTSSFFDLALEPERYEVAVRLLSLSEEAGIVPDSAAEVLALTLHALRRLLPGGRNPIAPELVTAVFLLKLMQIMGLAPHLTGCIRCGTAAIDVIRFSHRAGGFLCEACDPEDPTAVPVTAGVAKAMLYTLCSPAETVFRFTLAPELVEELLPLMERFLSDRWDVRQQRHTSLYATTEGARNPSANTMPDFRDP